MANMLFYGKKILFIGAHPDDIELGAGAFISNIAPHCDVLCLTLSDNQKNPLLKKVVDELHASLQVLGVNKEQVIVEKFITREFPKYRQDILETLLKIRREFKPELVFVHSRADIHQDHNVATEEALRAFRGTSLFGFDVVRSSYGFFPHFLVEVTEQDVNRKLEALNKYNTYNEKYYFDPALLRATMVRHGALAEVPFAEGFDILRIVGKFAQPTG